MLENQIERREVRVRQYTKLLNEEIECLERFMSATAAKGLSPEPKSKLTVSSQVDNAVSTINSMARVIARHESELVKHKEILAELKMAWNELGGV